jgi:Leucine-rich repeat (LRR) protein
MLKRDRLGLDLNVSWCTYTSLFPFKSRFFNIPNHWHGSLEMDLPRSQPNWRYIILFHRHSVIDSTWPTRPERLTLSRLFILLWRKSSTNRLCKLLNLGNCVNTLYEMFKRDRLGLDLILDHNQIEDISYCFTDIPSLIQLDLRHNRIGGILHSGYFFKSSSLQQLFLSFNKINIIERGTFDGLIHLKIVDLTYNNISTKVIHATKSRPVNHFNVIMRQV